MESYLHMCNVARYLAINTWERIGFARKRSGLKIFETTITQNILFYLLEKSRDIVPEITIQESLEEKKNGADILLAIKLDTGKYIEFAIQAKIIYHSDRSSLKNGKYLSMYHSVTDKWKKTKRQQIDVLLEFAEANNMQPLYLLYNYISDTAHFKSLHDLPSIYGCTIVNPLLLHSKIHSRIIPTFKDLHPDYALPWSELFCSVEGTLNSVFKNTGIRKGTIKTKTFEQLLADPKWKSLTQDTQTDFEGSLLDEPSIVGYQLIDKIVSGINKFSKTEEDHSHFLPAFRIIIGKPNSIWNQGKDKE